ncbi:uncharacterized protein PGTG_16088 [Puccinia graminis f. sp. tritici CRL 75-36-700-3]|uniref:Uncharacterized protein n=1 Tax=Puccinia graminis f. sp. tritici (strain CRL 75-36-700-3 / race SCCL) TaxID=418459 RepID=E3L1S6_PUCGT|nr:uncharacterized protein PGTG_16088 [Puccinia graminis f. sp. tritici CRL 75-36-700-3]EFP90501.2 hypothetical protein PGTG_16088 [Puccinia graminis f. sp. tritici CRL 75-36-700-3]
MNPSPPQLKPNTILILIPDKVCKGRPPSTTIPDQLAHQKPTATHSQDWITLIKHGDSVFVDKVRYPQNSGAPAVVVCDWQQSPTISFSQPSSPQLTIYVPADTSNLTIPSVFVASEEIAISV